MYLDPGGFVFSVQQAVQIREGVGTTSILVERHIAWEYVCSSWGCLEKEKSQCVRSVLYGVPGNRVASEGRGGVCFLKLTIHPNSPLVSKEMAGAAMNNT